MNDRPPVYMVAEAFLFGLIVPAGLFYVLRGTATVFAFGWFGVLVCATALVGDRRRHTTGALLGGALLGTITGFWGFAQFVGWGLTAFVLPLLAAVAVVLGSWLGYERDRRRGKSEEPPWGTWRSVFAILVSLPVAILALLVFA